MLRTTFDTIWNNHIVYPQGNHRNQESSPLLIYIDRHLIHEVTSPQAFEGLRLSGRKVRRPELTFATMDHNVPTTNRSLPIIDQVSSIQIQTLAQNCREFGITLFDLASPDQGIVHIILRLTVRLVHLHLESVLVKLNMCWLPSVYGLTSQRHLQ
jgi:3-isopropylmalate/(R)-2-methylmalate dehydratase large subunit